MADQFNMNYFEGSTKGGGTVSGDSVEIIPAERANTRSKRKWLFISNNSLDTMWLAFGNAGPAEIGEGVPIAPGQWFEQDIRGITTSAVHLISEGVDSAYSWHLGI